MFESLSEAEAGPWTPASLISPSANIQNASYDLLMKSASENLLIRTPSDVMRPGRTREDAGQKTDLRAWGVCASLYFLYDQTLPWIKGQRSFTHSRSPCINIAPDLI